MDKAHALTDEALDRMDRELIQIYTRAQKELKVKAEAFFKRFEKEDALKRALLEKGKITKAEYEAWRKKKIMSGSRFTKMKEQCAQQLLHTNEIAAAFINDQLPYVYSINYNAVESQVEGLAGYSFHVVSPETVKTLAGRDTSLLPFKHVDPKADIPWNMRAINSEVLQGILQGESVKAISKRIAGYTTHSGTDMGKVLRQNAISAMRTARTLVTASENKGRQDSYDRLTNDGVIIKKKWLATLDKRVRDSHLALHEQMVDENKPFDNGLMFPADPKGAPEEVYNCRCSMAAVVVGFRRV